MNTKKTTKSGREGKHRAGSVRMGVYVTPHRKAVAVLCAQECGMTLTDIIWKGIENIAIGRGILNADGKVMQDFKDMYDIAIEVVRQSEVNG